jgi:sRNA-binding carbon storage regulator CsrA
MSNPTTFSLINSKHQRPGNRLLAGHTILIKADIAKCNEALLIGLADQPIELLVSETGQDNADFARIDIYAPAGIEIEPLGAENGTHGRVKSDHHHLTLSRYPGQSFLIRPSTSFSIEECVRDLCEQGIFIHMARIQYQQARMSISATNKWDIVRRELDNRYSKFIDKARTSLMFMANAKHHMEDDDYKKLMHESSSPPPEC